jgi:hypothetical protein
MKKLYTVILIVFNVYLSYGQTDIKEQIPSDLKNSNVLIIQYSYDNWDTQYIDSTHDQWVTNRYGKDLLYKNYIEALKKAINVLKKNNINYKIITSKTDSNYENYKYLFDYKQIIIDNHTSIVADKNLGGFFFMDIKAIRRYKPIVENKKYIGKIIKEGLKNGA